MLSVSESILWVRVFTEHSISYGSLIPIVPAVTATGHGAVRNDHELFSGHTYFSLNFSFKGRIFLFLTELIKHLSSIWKKTWFAIQEFHWNHKKMYYSGVDFSLHSLSSNKRPNRSLKFPFNLLEWFASSIVTCETRYLSLKRLGVYGANFCKKFPFPC
jgi:hypothetical protein